MSGAVMSSEAEVFADDVPASSEADLEADARLDRYLENYLEAAMDLPRLGESLSAEHVESSGEKLPSSRRAPSPPEPLPAWLRRDQDLLRAQDLDEDFDDFSADEQTEPALGLRSLRWIRKNMTSFKVTVSLQRPTPPAGKTRKSS